MIIIKYETEVERDTIIADKTEQGYILVEIQNVTEGNFLGFQEPDWLPPEIEPDTKEQIKTLQEENAALLLQVATLDEKAVQQSTDTASLILQNAQLELDNIKLAEDYATLILELTLKEVI